MKLTCVPDRGQVPCGRSFSVVTLVSLGILQSSAPLSRRPVNLAVVIDESGSMKGKKLFYVKESLKHLVSSLHAQDLFSVVAFSDKARSIIKHGSPSQKEKIRRKIEKIHADGRTNLSDGWLTAAKSLRKVGEEYMPRILLMADGLVNEGIKDPDELRVIARRLKDEGITTSTFGYGDAFDENTLMAIADSGAGHFYYIETPEEAPDAFSQEFDDLFNLYAEDVTLRFDPEPEVEFLSQFNEYPQELDNKGVTIRLGDMYENEFKKVVIKFMVPAYLSPGERMAGTFTLSYIDAMSEEKKRVETSQTLAIQHVPIETPPDPHPAVMREVELITVARAIDEAKKVGLEGDPIYAAEILTTARQNLKASPYLKDEIDELDAMLAEYLNRLTGGEDLQALGKRLATTSFDLKRTRHFKTAI